MIKSLLTEYGLYWVFNRILYSAKLKMMMRIPITEKIFEKKVNVQRINIFNLNVEGITAFLRSLSREKKIEIISQAEKAIYGTILGFSSIELDYGNPINWHYNPLTKVVTSKRVKWYRIPDFDAARGDIKIIWEASRFTHFFIFSRAFMISGNKKYYYAFSAQLEHWLQENPYPYGANYKCGQESALRMINALMSYTVFKYYNVVTAKDEKNVFKLIEVCYKKILANFFYAHKCIKNNHTLSEILGLIIGAWCCGNQKELNNAYRLLDKEVKKQFLPDGGYIQYSFNYQRLALQLMECVFKISEKTEIQVAEKTKTLIKNSCMLMYQMQLESGDMPNYGYNDGALIFPVTVCGYRDFRPVVNTVFALVTGNRLLEQGDYDEELLWFGNGRLESLSQVTVEKKPSSFHASGFYTLRHDNGFLMTVLHDFHTRPAHMDGLHIDLWHKGINIFCDSGTVSYATKIGNNLILTSSHNTVQVNSKEQMKKNGPFMIYNWTSVNDIRHNFYSFTGTMLSQNGYSHRRVIHNTEYGYEVEEEVKGNGEYCEFNFHTPCKVRLVPGGFELIEEGAVICAVAVNAGELEVKKAYRSLYYLKTEEINRITINHRIKNKKCHIKLNIILGR